MSYFSYYVRFYYFANAAITSYVNNDLWLKAKDLYPKAKAKAKDLGPKAKAKDLSATAKAKDLKCQGQISHRSFHIVFLMFMFFECLYVRVLFAVLTAFCQFLNKWMLLLWADDQPTLRKHSLNSG